MAAYNQLPIVIYFLIDIKNSNLGPRSLVKTLQEFTQSLLKNFSIESDFIEGAPGVYVKGKKIASIGLRISKGKSYHGISINVDMDLQPFTYINPCGYEGMQVTQIKDFKFTEAYLTEFKDKLSKNGYQLTQIDNENIFADWDKGVMMDVEDRYQIEFDYEDSSRRFSSGCFSECRVSTFLKDFVEV